MDRGAWWATAHRVAKSQIRLKQLSMHMLFILFICSTNISYTLMVCLVLCMYWNCKGFGSTLFVYSILLTPSYHRKT